MVSTKKPTKRKPVKKKTTLKTVKRPTAPKDHNLNHRFNADIQAHRKEGVVVQNVSSVELVFDSIEARLVKELKKPTVKYALLISPWCSNHSILKALASLSGASILTYRDKHTKSASRMKLYQAMTPLNRGMDRVRYLQSGSGRQKSIIHEKMLVFLDGSQTPISAAWGSWNSSGGSSSNIEMFSICYDQRVATVCFNEFFRIYNIARPLC